MRYRLFFVVLLVASCTLLANLRTEAQSEVILRTKVAELQQKPSYATDTAYLNAVNALAFEYANSSPDSAFELLKMQLERCRKINYRQGEANALKILGSAHSNKGNFDSAMDNYNAALALATSIKYKAALPALLNNIGIIYMQQGNYQTALTNYFKALTMSEEVANRFVQGAVLNNIAQVYFFQGKYQEALINYNKVIALAEEAFDTTGIIIGYRNLGETQLLQGLPALALSSASKALRLSQQRNDEEMKESSLRMTAQAFFGMDSVSQAVSAYQAAIVIASKNKYMVPLCQSILGLAEGQWRLNERAPAIANAKRGLEMADTMGHVQLMRDANQHLSEWFEAEGDARAALFHFKAYKIGADSINSLAGERLAVSLQMEYDFSKRALDFEKRALKQRWLSISAFMALVAVALVAVVFYRGRQRTKHLYVALQQQSNEVQQQKLQLEATLGELKSAQAQLIQSEKMASLAELTAGIAHEIQNPLNFVNNFSEVSTEMIDEMAQALADGNTAEALELANDVRGNLEKIVHHGKRAEDIVRGMLQHSRTSGGEREPTDLNRIIDEYLRLAYHGLRAKNSAFNAKLEANLDPDLQPITVVAQDIGRVILNLITNAFHAVAEKQQLKLPNYAAIVSVQTNTTNGKVQIRIKDNGTGIPEAIKNKIFQPFFTTKPAGQGTGLGLSLSYDIVKAHGGALTVDSVPGEGSVFLIELPTDVVGP